jgi:biotin carboxyl carrier protein
MKNFKVTVNGRAYDVCVEEVGDSAGQINTAPPVQPQAIPVVAVAPVAPAAPQATSKPVAVSAGDIPVNAPLSGSIMAIKVKPGETVKYGQVLLTLEALKMENEIVAPQAGVVKELFTQAGATVNVGDILLTLRS